jgi:hypothetical protein
MFAGSSPVSWTRVGQPSNARRSWQAALRSYFRYRTTCGDPVGALTP